MESAEGKAGGRVQYTEREKELFAYLYGLSLKREPFTIDTFHAVPHRPSVQTVRRWRKQPQTSHSYVWKKKETSHLSTEQEETHTVAPPTLPSPRATEVEQVPRSSQSTPHNTVPALPSPGLAKEAKGKEKES